MFGRNRSIETSIERRQNRFIGSRLQKLGAIAGFAAVLAACGFGESPQQIGRNNLVTDHLPSATPTTSGASSGEAATSSAAVTTVTHPETASASPTQASPSRKTTESPAPTTAAPTSSSPTKTTRATRSTAQTEFAIDCAADSEACTPDGDLPVYNSPFRGVNGEVYALNAHSNGDARTGVTQPASGELKPLCKGMAGGILWIMVQTDASWAEPQNSGQGNPFSGYAEAAAVPGAAAAVGSCSSDQDYSGNF